jgi:hypothetical protein
MPEDPGRPRYIILEDVLVSLKSLGYTWQEISSLLLVSRTTLWRRVDELGIRNQIGYSQIGYSLYWIFHGLWSHFFSWDESAKRSSTCKLEKN